MPLLDDDYVRQMKADHFECPACERSTNRNYCRQCDEFFTEGHADGCTLAFGQTEHQGHRTY